MTRYAPRIPDRFRAAEPLIRLGAWMLAFLIAYRLQLRLEDKHTGWRELLLLLSAGTLVVFAAWPWRPDRRAAPEPDQAPGGGGWRSRPLVALLPFGLLAAGLALGLLFRAFDLNERPVGISFDEAQNGLIARDILDGKRPPMFIGGFTQLPSAFFYLYALSARIVGEDVISLRLVSTLGGLAALPLLFLCARELFGTRTAALAVVLLAIMRWHVNFSRFGVTNIYAATFVTGAVAFFARGIRGGSRWNFAVSGLFVGMTPYAGFYGVFVPFVIGLYWLHTAVFDRALELRQHLVSIVIVAAVAMMVYAPVAIWGTLNGDEYLSRPGTASIFKGKTRQEGLEAAVKSAKKHVLMFNSAGDHNGRHNLPRAPMLDRVTGILFLLGLAILATRLHRSSFFLLLAWMTVFLQNGIWSVDFEAPQAFRTSATTPAVAMIAALPLAALWDLAARARPAMNADSGRRRTGRLAQSWVVGGVAGVAIVGLLGYAAWRNFDTYFNKQLDHPQVWRDWNTDIALVARELRDAPPEQRILMSSLFSSPVIDYIDHDTVNRNSYQIDLQRDIPLAEARSTLILLDVTKASWVDWIKVFYPSAQVTEFGPPGENSGTQAYRIVVTEDAARALLGVDAVYTRPGETPLGVREPAINADWPADGAPMAYPFQARWRGTVRITDTLGGTLRFAAPGDITMSVNGADPVRGRGDVAAAGPLARGLHTFDITATIDGPGMVQLQSATGPVAPANLFAGEATRDQRGLLATFYAGGEYSGPPLLLQIDPFVAFRYHAELPFSGPFSVTWQGQLLVEEAGTYAFRLEPTGDASLHIDGLEVVPAPGTAEGKLNLRTGWHRIELRYRNLTGYAGIFMRWQPPDRALHIIPATNLRPPP